ncbi:MAG TPA: DUF4188 domain-containing protein [Terriglobales bacterium]|nr:DUF4188 domain-containing protein [Terriglobales bacterium]
MAEKVNRQTVDLSGFPDLVVIYLGMKVRTLRGLKTLFSFGPRISRAVAEKPEGLLVHDFFLLSIFPLHLGMRQYWRNFELLENWSRSLPHQDWWKQFLRDSGGTGFWHETYFMRGGMEAIYDDVGSKLGLLQFAPSDTARGPMFSARKRAGREGESSLANPVPETEL